MSEHREREESRAERPGAEQEAEQAEERAMSVFASERREDVIAIILVFAFMVFVLIFFGIG